MNHITHSVEVRKQLMIQKSMEAHGDKYDYSKVIYTKAQAKVEIVCPLHGSFWQNLDSHSHGTGCPTCGREKSKIDSKNNIRKTTEQFISECKEIHNNYYTYPRTVYVRKTDKVIITCPIHGDFEQKALIHREGHGCPTCGISKAHTHFLQSTEAFIRKSKEIHGDTYDYSCTIYTGKEKPIAINCKKHGPFILAKANYHYLGHTVGCPKCSMSGTSKAEQELAEFIQNIVPEYTVVQNSRSFIPPLEIDIIVHEKKLAIEFNGDYWHSEGAGKDRNYHLNKTNLVEAQGYQLIHVMEYEWTNSKEIVKTRIRHLLGKTQEKYYARKLELRQVKKLEADPFFSETHIQGPCTFSQGYGLYSGNTLVACMTFGMNRFTKEGDIELLRYSTRGTVVGGFSKLLKSFHKNNPETSGVTSYSDKRWSVGKVYSSNGFVKVGDSTPGYAYVDKEGKKYNRVVCQKHKLPTFLGEKFDAAKTETENMLEAGFVKIYDCGMDKWKISF